MNLYWIGSHYHAKSTTLFLYVYYVCRLFLGHLCADWIPGTGRSIQLRRKSIPSTLRPDCKHTYPDQVEPAPLCQIDDIISTCALS